jgi:hypothetical protein
MDLSNKCTLVNIVFLNVCVGGALGVHVVHIVYVDVWFCLGILRSIECKVSC